jgi:large subunit ribosomal protein L25
MKLTVVERKKGGINRLRREGKIPAVLYGHNVQGELLSVSLEEMQTILRNMKQGMLSTTVFELHDGKHKRKAIVKEIQYQVATYAIEHIDFLLLDDKIPVTINVPIQITGLADCTGIKLGGFLRQPIRTMKVSCLPRHIPSAFQVDVKELELLQSKRLSDIALPQGVKPLSRLTEVAVVIAKKA